MSNNLLDRLERLIEESAKKRTSFLLALTKSSRAISDGAKNWFESEVNLLKKEMKILESVMPEDVHSWQERLGTISKRFQKAISYLNEVISKAEKGQLTSIGEVHPSKKGTFPLAPTPILEAREGEIIQAEEEEEKKLDLVSSILEVFDSASNLEKLINEVEKESKRVIRTARLAIKVIQK